MMRTVTPHRARRFWFALAVVGGCGRSQKLRGARSRSAARPLPVPPADSAPRPRDAWILWAVVSVCVLVFATMIVTMSLVGDWDDPMPPNPVAAWSVAGVAAASTWFVAWRTRNRSVVKAAIVAIPLQALYWALLVMPAAGQPN